MTHRTQNRALSAYCAALAVAALADHVWWNVLRGYGAAVGALLALAAFVAFDSRRLLAKRGARTA